MAVAVIRVRGCVVSPPILGVVGAIEVYVLDSGGVHVVHIEFQRLYCVSLSGVVSIPSIVFGIAAITNVPNR